jgi:hypothetical protein
MKNKLCAFFGSVEMGTFLGCYFCDTYRRSSTIRFSSATVEKCLSISSASFGLQSSSFGEHYHHLSHHRDAVVREQLPDLPGGGSRRRELSNRTRDRHPQE